MVTVAMKDACSRRSGDVHHDPIISRVGVSPKYSSGTCQGGEVSCGVCHSISIRRGLPEICVHHC